jgi:hypothetical protein
MGKRQAPARLLPGLILLRMIAAAPGITAALIADDTPSPRARL